MSWNGYVENMEKEGCKFASFHDLNGNLWAKSANNFLDIKPEQIHQIVKGLKQPSSVDLRANSPMLGDRKFIVIQMTDTSCVMKQLGGDDKVMACLGLFNSGACLGVSEAGEKEKCSRACAEKYSDYLRSISY